MAENYVLLETIELTSTASSVTFDNIPQTGYTDLKIVWSGRVTDTSIATYCKISINGSSSSLTASRFYGSGSGTGGTGTLNQFAGTAPGASATSQIYSSVELYFPNYTGSNYKTYSIDSVTENNATEAYNELGAGLWSSNSTIQSITIAPNAGNFESNSTFSLYGIADVNTTPNTAPFAIGGDIVANDGTYWYHAFLTSGVFTPKQSLTADVLVIAGGGGGGANQGGGGGAGGLRGLTTQSFTSSVNYNCAIGAGGRGTPYGDANTSGNNSSVSGSGFTTISASGGGRGANINVAATGGSGGGGSANSGLNTGAAGNAGSYSPVEGYAGGNGSGGAQGGAGGGGAGGVGGSYSQSYVGGIGSSAYSSWGVATSTGENVAGTYYYAGGGGGGVENSYSAAGGYGGGGRTSVGGFTARNGVRGTGGGGAGHPNGSTNTGTNGGSGIVIIRYAMV